MTATLPGSGQAAPYTPFNPTPPAKQSVGAIVSMVIALLVCFPVALIAALILRGNPRYRTASRVGLIGGIVFAAMTLAVVAFAVVLGVSLGHNAGANAPVGQPPVATGAVVPQQSPPVAVTTIKPGPKLNFAAGAQGDIQLVETEHSKALAQSDPKFLKRYYANTNMAGYKRDLKIEGSTIQQDPDPWTLVKVKVLSATSSQIVANVTFQLAHGTITYTNTYTAGAGSWQLVDQKP